MCNINKPYWLPWTCWNEKPVRLKLVWIKRSHIRTLTSSQKSHYSLHPCGLRGLSSAALLWSTAFITLRSHAGDTQGTARLCRPANCSLPDPDWAQLRPEQNSSAYHHNEEQLLSVRATTKALQMIQRMHANVLTSLCRRWKQHAEIVFEFTVFRKQVKKYTLIWFPVRFWSALYYPMRGFMNGSEAMQLSHMIMITWLM